jgi:hypothetical protein
MRSDTRLKPSFLMFIRGDSSNSTTRLLERFADDGIWGDASSETLEQISHIHNEQHRLNHATQLELNKQNVLFINKLAKG